MASKLVLAMLVALSGSPLWGQELQDDIVSQLRAQGFSNIEVSRTFLGRTRIVATSNEIWREIVINPNTGLILRDYFVDNSETKNSGRRSWFSSISNPSSETGAAPGGGDGGGNDGGDNGGGNNGEGDDGGDGGEGDDGGDDSGGEDGGGEDGGGEDGGDGGEGDNGGHDGDGGGEGGNSDD